MLTEVLLAMPFRSTVLPRTSGWESLVMGTLIR